MNRDRLMFLFQKYADKSCTEDEYAEFLTYISKESSAEEVDFLLNIEWELGLADQKLSHTQADQIFDRVMISDQKKSLKFSWKYGWAAAASTVLIGLAVLFYPKPKISEPQQEIAILKDSVNLVAESTSAAEHKQVRLPDGTVVILNSNSTLSFPLKFSDHGREVTLKGEGYFDVKHDVNRPFIVHTGKVKTTVLGTAFNINAYDQSRNVVITVTRGKVMVQDEQKTLAILVPDQQVVFNKVENKAALIKLSARQVVEWQEKDLFFDDVTMLQAAEVLSKRFNVKIVFESDATKSCRFTATFLKGEKLDEILQIITSFNHAKYELKSGDILISGKGCK